jgi:hypothetical protein
LEEVTSNQKDEQEEISGLSSKQINKMEELHTDNILKTGHGKPVKIYERVLKN